ncbi:MAG: DoxX family protein [Flavobacteriaceae bacterium]|nr:DoxX family protein [Flavobacteriaceae bacterium]
MKKNKILFYVTTGLLSIIMLGSASMYFFDYQTTTSDFEAFGYPSYIIYPYGIAKLLGVFALWHPNFKVLKEWAYAGFFFAFILAFFAHYMIGDGKQVGAIVALVLLTLSYVFSKRIKQ